MGGQHSEKIAHEESSPVRQSKSKESARIGDSLIEDKRPLSKDHARIAQLIRKSPRVATQAERIAQLQKASSGGAENRTGMPDSLKSGIEQLSGMDMSRVRVHTRSAEPAKVNAHAFAQGSNIHIASGQEKHLPHEAWHTVQQMQGRVKPTTESGGVPINDDPGLEREADVMGAKAAQMKVDESERDSD